MKIIVDLDGTLIESDSSFSIWRKLWKHNLFMGLCAIVFYLFKGEAYTKNYLKSNRKNYGKVHYKINKKLINYLKNLQVKNKAHLILATGANLKVAQEFNAEYGLFKDIIASCEKVNCIGIHKLNAIRNLIGNHEFMYIADAWYDCPIWAEASIIGVVNPNKQLFLFLQKLAIKKKSKLIKFD